MVPALPAPGKVPMHNLYENFFRVDIIVQFAPYIAEGMLVTVALGIAIIVSGLLLGLFLAGVRVGGLRLINFPIVLFVDLFRALPPLVVIVIFYFAFPLVGIVFTQFQAVWLALTFKLAAFAEEIFFASMLVVGRQQWEAGASTGMSFLQILRYIIVPQAFRMSIAPLTSRTISTVKNTALGAVIGLPEILGQAAEAQSAVMNTTPLMMAAVAYLVIFFPLVVGTRFIENRYRWVR